MEFSKLNRGMIIINDFDIKIDDLFFLIKNGTKWDNSISSRMTASYGVPYNYSNINYEPSKFPNYIFELAKQIENIIGFLPNNCLLNYYYNSESRMGFHSDQIDILEDNTGIAILSLGASRIMRFKNKVDNKIVFDIILNSKSLFYMDQTVQNQWLHSILPEKEKNTSERISLTFRKLRNTY
jgi:alkylated DNA repair dioxygenase AlkB